jgi:hypothetical protein
MMNNDKIKEAILKTIIFFDLFNYPLTNWEIWQYLNLEINLGLSEKAVEDLINAGKIEQKDGFYFLPGRSEVTEIRRQRYNYANYKIKLANRATKLFKWLPSVKLVAVANLIGHHNLRNESDVDIFIVSSPNRLWLTRLFCTGLMKITKQRPTKECKRNKMCLSFYAAADGLAMESLRFKPSDPYFDHWFLGLYPIYDNDKYLAYLRFKNPWLKSAFPNSLLLRENFPDNYFSKNWLDWVLYYGANFLNSVSKKIQIAIMPKVLKDLANKDTGVVLNDQILRFYVKDKRQEFLDKYNQRLAEFNLYE